jgi:hypothetical protein
VKILGYICHKEGCGQLVFKIFDGSIATDSCVRFNHAEQAGRPNAQCRLVPVSANFFRQVALMGGFMKKASSVMAFAASLVFVCLGDSWANDVASQPQLQKLQADAVPALKRAVAQAAGYKLADITATVSSHVVTRTVANSKLNAAASPEIKN